MDKDKCLEITRIFNTSDYSDKKEVIALFSDCFLNKLTFDELIRDISNKYKGFSIWPELLVSDKKIIKESNCTYEDEIDKVFKKYSKNDNREDVLYKTLLLNQFYNTGLYTNGGKQMPSIIEMSDRIVRVLGDTQINYDVDVKKLVEDLCDLKHDSSINSRSRPYSFVSKYLSFTFRASYIDMVPITDQYARKTLKYLTGKRTDITKYDKYYDELVDTFSPIYGGKDKIEYKKVDAFLWIMGKVFSM